MYIYMYAHMSVGKKIKQMFSYFSEFNIRLGS